VHDINIFHLCIGTKTPGLPVTTPPEQGIIDTIRNTGKGLYTVRKVIDFPFPAGIITNQTLPSREHIHCTYHFIALLVDFPPCAKRLKKIHYVD
jgi:hypothetical protein